MWDNEHFHFEFTQHIIYTKLYHETEVRCGIKQMLECTTSWEGT